METTRRILVVDDHEDIRASIRDALEALGYQVETAQDGFEALAKLEFEVDLVLSDVDMPGMDGFELVRRIRQSAETSDLPIIMVTGMTSQPDRLRAVEAGANDFIAKPVDFTEIRVRTHSLLQMKAANDEIKRHKAQLETSVAQRTASLRQALDQVVQGQRQFQAASLETIERLAVVAEYKDSGTANHIQRMARICAELARRLGLPPGEVELIMQASPMHDIGKVGVPERILLKPGGLDDGEWELMRQHPSIGARILSNSSSPLLQAGEIMALAHHEKWDGSGYPHGLQGQDIPLYGRICAVADVFDALTSERPYKRKFTNEEAYRVVRDGRGAHFDPELVDLFLGMEDALLTIQAEGGDG
jgi:putative two-component system response regulator